MIDHSPLAFHIRAALSLRLLRGIKEALPPVRVDGAVY